MSGLNMYIHTQANTTHEWHTKTRVKNFLTGSKQPREQHISSHLPSLKLSFNLRAVCGKRNNNRIKEDQGAPYLSLDAPSAKTMGSAISSMDCRMEATTMKRMMLSRNARWTTWSSMRPVCTARISRVTPSVIPLTGRQCTSQFMLQMPSSSKKALQRLWLLTP